MPLSAPAIRHLHLLLADAASGSPRQWWHLELAARSPAAPPGRRARLLGLALRWLGPDRLMPCLRLSGLDGLSPYRLAQPGASSRLARHGALLALCLLAVLHGLGSLNASRQLGLVLLMLFGAAWRGWRAGRAAFATRRAVLAASEARMAELAPAESALGLISLLLASGRDYQTARQQAQAMRDQPDALSPALADTLALNAPTASAARQHAWRAALAHAAGVLAVAWPCWLAGQAWQLLPASLGLVLTHYVCAEQQARWWQGLARPLLLALSGLGLAVLLRWLY